MSQDFELYPMDVFSISGAGYVVTGTITAGSVSLGDLVVARGGGVEQVCTVTEVSRFGTPIEVVPSAAAGDTLVGLKLRGFAPKKLPGALDTRNPDGSLTFTIRAAPPGAVAVAGKPWWKFW